ncbi:MAG: hypothetical protein ACRDYE_02135, partial [Acidimicrobiales bacterium]
MGNADATRVMAKEHDLEFVDLDTYGVDPAASAMLPASMSREHHVVVLKRRFGTPVIATADPEDRSAQDTLRTSIGRDFISVVATRDQIGDYLDQLFGSDGAETSRAELDSENGNGPFGGLLSDRSVMIPRSAKNRRQGGERRSEVDATPPIGEPTSVFGEPSSESSSGLPFIEPPAGLSNFEPDTVPSPPASTDKLAEIALTVPVEEPPAPSADPLVPSTEPLAAGAGDLAEVALSVPLDEQPQTSVDSTAIAADLVDEAVATYQEQHGEEARPDAPEGEEPAETAMFPPLAKALV